MGPKALLELAGAPLLTWVSRKALRLSADVVVAVPPGLVENYAVFCPGCRVIEGGETRQKSVEVLLQMSRLDYVLVVDVARPFASLALYQSVLEAVDDTGAAGAFLQPEVPVAHIVDGRVDRSFQRDEVGVFQSPQAFSRNLLQKVMHQANSSGWEEQSTLQLVLRAGLEVKAVAGEKHNIKLTTPEDWRIAQQFTEHLQ